MDHSSIGSSTVRGSEPSVLTQQKLQGLVAQIDPKQKLDEDVQDVLLQMADDFIESAVSASCQLAKHRKSNTLETKDLQVYLESSWNMSIPGFTSEDQSATAKKATGSEAHKQRLNQIKRSKR